MGVEGAWEKDPLREVKSRDWGDRRWDSENSETQIERDAAW